MKMAGAKQRQARLFFSYKRPYIRFADELLSQPSPKRANRRVVPRSTDYPLPVCRQADMLRRAPVR